MRRTSLPKSLVLYCAVPLIVGFVMLIPSSAAKAAPPLCDGKPATIVGTEGDDVLRGTNGDDVIVGRGGDDRLMGGGGNDTLCGQRGNDALVGGSGDDVLVGGPGSDWVSYGRAPFHQDRPNGVVVRLAAGTATGWGIDQLTSIENIIGSRWRDHLVGNRFSNVIKGGDGWDKIKGRRGNDHLLGGPDTDALWGDAGNDLLDGHEGGESLYGGWGNDILRGGPGHDFLIPGGGDDIVDGGGDTDHATYAPTGPGGVPSPPNGIVVDLRTGTVSGYGNDTLAGVEMVSGTEHDDVLIGGPGNDDFYGGWGDDYLDGGDGWDILHGGPDNDRCVRGEIYQSCEVIL